MGGLATVVAAGIIAIVFMQAFSAYYSTSTQSSNLLLQSLKDQAQQMEDSIHESLFLSNLTIVNSTSIMFAAANTGTVSIPAVDFGEMDVFLEYTTNSSAMAYLEVGYQPGTESNDTWRVVSVTTSTGGPAVFDPISIPAATSGQWDPSEVLHIAITMSASDGITNSSSAESRMCTPAGVCSSISV